VDKGDFFQFQFSILDLIFHTIPKFFLKTYTKSGIINLKIHPNDAFF